MTIIDFIDLFLWVCFECLRFCVELLFLDSLFGPSGFESDPARRLSSHDLQVLGAWFKVRKLEHRSECGN